MANSFIFDDLQTLYPGTEFIEHLGWFNAGQFQLFSDRVNYVEVLGTDSITINKDTLIAYFPGCFAEFHDGHRSVIERVIAGLRQTTENYVVVIAPANSDYTTSKYGSRSVYATNHYRYTKIRQSLSDMDGKVVIDLNPMLNHDRDYNFTDLLRDFVTRQNLRYDDLTFVPYVVCGKDRKNFAGLEQFTSLIRVWYEDDVTGLSSSSLVDKSAEVDKRDLILRCENVKQFNAFKSVWGDEYLTIEPMFLKGELEKAAALAKQCDITICKEYADLLPYVKTSRTFVNPLRSISEREIDATLFSGKVVLDSDIFSGATKRFIESAGGQLVAVVDISRQVESSTHELLDISDFYLPNFAYPYVDISWRCSMRAFDAALHKKFKDFKQQVLQLPRNVE